MRPGQIFEWRREDKEGRQARDSPALLPVRRRDVSPPPGPISPPPGFPLNWPRPAARPMERPTPSRLVSSLRTWPGDEPRTRCPYLDRRRPHRHAACHARVQRPGPNRSREEPVFRQVLCIPRPARRSDQDPLVRWRRTLSSPEEIGTRPDCVAASREWSRIPGPRASEPVFGRNARSLPNCRRGPDDLGRFAGFCGTIVARHIETGVLLGWDEAGDVADAAERVGGQS